MSSIYIQEPPTSGKVLLKTTVGDIDVELWSRECPKACRNFIQLCMEGYYNNTIFHRLVKGFIVQGGDPDGDGHGGESIYGEPFKDEFHSRLRYTRRGLVGMANSGKNDNGSQFFFTFAATPELQNMNTLFGKVTGDTIFNMLKLEEGMVDQNERPMYPHKILKTVILNNPFDDIVPRKLKKSSKEEGESSKKKSKKGVKNYGLLSFGEEAEEDEIEATEFVQKVGNKGKSTHDVLDDPKLSKEEVKIERRSKTPEPDLVAKEKEEAEIKKRQEMVREKLSKKKAEIAKKESDGDSDEDVLSLIDREKMEEKQKKAQEIRKEIAKLKKGYASEKKAASQKIEEEKKEKEKHNKIIDDYLKEKAVYVEKVKLLPKKGASREDHTLALLAKFKAKLNSARGSAFNDDDDDEKDEEKETKPSSSNVNIDEEIQSDNWLSHKLRFESEIPVLAKDASTKGDDWYDVYDPRNPMNKRKRHEATGGDSKSSKSRKSDR
ncbi:spliceosome-associated protein CWC27 homolog [Culicoides brevitarsis]|uniref:spliceosome-associated protein CWC27 homolog n=1 Tax=Culicoides brevitarsis TaxID=469753 RepID=UPI00307C07C0